MLKSYQNEIYYLVFFCHDGRSDACYEAFRVFEKYVKKRNKHMELEYIVNGSTGPVYEIYIVQ